MYKQLLLAEIGKNIKEIDRNLDWYGYYPVFDENETVVGIISIYTDVEFEIDEEKNAVALNTIEISCHKTYYDESDFDLKLYFKELANSIRNNGGNCMEINILEYEFGSRIAFKDFIEQSANAKYVATKNEFVWIFRLL